MGRGYPAGMKTQVAFVLTSILIFCGCDERPEVTVTETRAASARDLSPNLAATSDERFRDVKPSPVMGDAPENWLVLPPSQFRLLNYRFGDSGTGEVWVSLSEGSVLDNVNRWLTQFGGNPLDQTALEKLEKFPIAGAQGVWVTVAGDYSGAMNAPTRPGFGLAGVVANVGKQILTVKMVGPKAEVEAAKPALEAYATSLRMVE